MAKLFDLSRSTDGRTYTLRNVPIFKTHDDRGFNCDEKWLDEAIENHNLRKAKGYLPSVFVGHTSKNGEEKEAIGFLDTLYRKGKIIYANIAKIPETIAQKFKANAFPNRSCEVLPKSKRIVGLAFLGATPPHFALPSMIYEQTDEKSHWVNYEQQEEKRMSGIGEMSPEQFGEIVANAVVAGIENYNTKMENEEQEEYQKFVDGLSKEEKEAFNLNPELFLELYGQYGPGVVDVDVIQQTSGGPLNEEAVGEETNVDRAKQIDVGNLDDTMMRTVDEKGAVKSAGAPEVEPGTAVAEMTQMKEDTETLAYAIRDLQEEVDVLTTANRALQSQKAASEIKAYLMDLKARGYALNEKDIDHRVDMMMRMDEDLRKDYMKDLESSLPKVPTGRFDFSGGLTKAQLGDSNELAVKFEANEEKYRAAGVTCADDLKYVSLTGGEL